MSGRQVWPKALLIGAICATAAAPAFFIQLNEPTHTLNTWKLLAKIGSLCGTMLFFWQFLLGYRQAVARRVTPDYLWTIRLHKLLGVAGFALVLLHPTFITPYYLEKEKLWLFSLGLPGALGTFAPLGVAALLLLLAIVVTSLLLRKAMGRRTWYVTHLGSYVMLPLAFVHGYPIGTTLQNTGLRHVWHALFALTAAFYVLRVLARFGVFSRAYEVSEVRHAAEGVVELVMHPVGRALRPVSGQFAFFRRGMGGPARPFTISDFDAAGGQLSITVKALGRVTTALQTVKPGERFFVDGPYGIFGREALATDRPVVMLAGGIGITPFRKLIRDLESRPDREAFLFYGNQYEEDIAHRDEIEAARHVDLIHVLSGVEEHQEFEVGFITIDLLKKHLPGPLPRHEFLLCGPPAMITKLEAGLRAEGVPRHQIHHELFDY